MREKTRADSELEFAARTGPLGPGPAAGGDRTPFSETRIIVQYWNADLNSSICDALCHLGFMVQWNVCLQHPGHRIAFEDKLKIASCVIKKNINSWIEYAI
jgi:hypothetical protein